MVSNRGGDTGNVNDHEETPPSVRQITMKPALMNETGETPDYRFSLANERTFLAWLRTALALAGGGIAAAQFLPVLAFHGLREGIAVTLLVMAAVCAIRAVIYWITCELAMRLRRDLPISRFPIMLALIVAAGAVTLLVAVLAQPLLS